MIEPRRNPLAMYYFGKDKSEQEYLLSHVQSGGVCINDITLHYVFKRIFHLVVLALQVWVHIMVRKALEP
jgi:acyl-CoA reductase-like NAD-dependent aldehyde dehydrogenase